MITAGAARQIAEWPELPYEAWAPTLDTLHMNLQVIGKVRLALTHREPQWANVPLYVTARGLTTTPIWSGRSGFAIDVDLIDHDVVVALNDGRLERIAPPGPSSSVLPAVAGCGLSCRSSSRRHPRPWRPYGRWYGQSRRPYGPGRLRSSMPS